MASTAVVAIISAVLGAIIVLLATVIVVKWYLTRKTVNSTKKRDLRPNFSNNKNDKDATIVTEPIEYFLDEILNERPMRYSADQIVQITGDFKTEVGRGGFGVVYKGRLSNGLEVAVKVLKGTINKRSEEQFMAEIATVGRTYHMNLVKLYGFCFDGTTKALIYEYMANGSLDNFLFDNDNDNDDDDGKKTALEWDKLHGIAVATAKGIRYLHEECQQKIIHYDIKPANVLLTTDFVPKVADFGLARYCARKSLDSGGISSGTKYSSSTGLTGGRGTPGYAAPELWNIGQHVTCKCDVYSFGMLLFEILGRRRNLRLNTEDESERWFPKWVWQKFEQGELETILEKCDVGRENSRKKAERLCKVALWCVQYSPDARPTMSGVVRMLEGEIEIVPPTDPFVYLSGNTSSTDVSSTPWSDLSFGTTTTTTTTTGGFTTTTRGTDRTVAASPVETDMLYEISTR